jgi:S1-C subfamily serine protease
MAILLSRLLLPPAPQLTANEMQTAVAQMLASATPRPASSADVFQIIQPSFVIVQTTEPGDDTDSGGLGSGVIVNEAGDILTCLHVVAAASAIQVTFADGTQSAAAVVARQPEHDIAVLRAAKLPAHIIPATLGNPWAMRVGDEAYVIGNPLSLSGSLSAGVISGFDRSVAPVNSKQQLRGLIQIDAAVNPGSSGGPLLNRHGQVIGIVTGLVNPVGQNAFSGIGFAVPITVAGAAAGLPPA